MFIKVLVSALGISLWVKLILVLYKIFHEQGKKNMSEQYDLSDEAIGKQIITNDLSKLWINS